jgi:hypothetical protein
MYQFLLLLALAFGGRRFVLKSERVINQGDEALVEIKKSTQTWLKPTLHTSLLHFVVHIQM